MSSKADRRNAAAFERRVRELLSAGYSASAIAKETGKTYVHTARIVARIEQEKESCAT